MGLNISICYEGPGLFLKGDTILISDVTCCFQKRLQLHPYFTFSPALRVTHKHTGGRCPLGLPVAWEDSCLCHTPGLQWLPDFVPLIATCLHPLCMQWRIRKMQARRAELTKFWKSGSWEPLWALVASTGASQLTPWRYDILVTITFPSSLYAPEVCETSMSREES